MVQELKNEEQEQPLEEQQEPPSGEVVEPAPEATPDDEARKVSIHIWMPTDAYELIKKWARYATLEGLIQGHPKGNITDYCNFCFNLGDQYLKQYVLKKRGYR